MRTHSRNRYSVYEIIPVTEREIEMERVHLHDLKYNITISVNIM